MLTIDLLSSLAALGLLAAGALCYAIRYYLAGAAHFSRVNAAGASPLLGQGAMEFGYWCLQPLGDACARAGITADQITALSLISGAAAGLALACGHLGIGALLASLSALGDVLDGLVARATHSANPSGAIFDASVDRYTEFFLLGGLAFYDRASPLLLALALFSILGSFMVSYGSAKAEALRVTPPRGVLRRAERAVYLCGGLVLSPFAAALVAAGKLPAWSAEAPIFAVLAMVALVSNGSAALRLRAIARAAQPAAKPLGPALASAPPMLTNLSPVIGNLSNAMSSVPAAMATGPGVNGPTLRIPRTASQR